MDRSDVWPSDTGGERAVREFASDDFYRALANTLCRRLLFALLTAEEGTVDGPAELLYGWAVTTGEQANYDQIRTALHHSHLPKLDVCGLVEFALETGMVEQPGPSPDVKPLIEHSIAAELAHGEP